MGFLKKILKSFIKVSRPIFSLEDNTLKFKVNSDYFYTYTLENFEIKTRHDPYVIDAYTLKTKDFFLEHIRVDTDVSWNADALSLYENFLVENLKLKNIKLLEKKEFEHFEFIIYQIDKTHILPLIYVWEVYKDIFILDFNLRLYEDLISKFDNKYEFRFDKNNIYKIDFDESLVKLNAFKGYFNIFH